MTRKRSVEFAQGSRSATRHAPASLSVPMPRSRRRWRGALLVGLGGLSGSAAMDAAERARMRDVVREMFDHVYGGYKTHAFPHDELRPLSQTHTDSLVELGAQTPTRAGYKGVALTLIDSLDTLAIVGNHTEVTSALLPRLMPRLFPTPLLQPLPPLLRSRLPLQRCFSRPEERR